VTGDALIVAFAGIIIVYPDSIEIRLKRLPKIGNLDSTGG